MSDQQLLTLTLSIVIPISLSLAALIYSNSRISEAKETLRAEIKAETATLCTEMAQLRTEIQAEIGTLRTEMAQVRTEMAELRGEMGELRAHIDAGFERIAHALQLHILEHHK